MAMESRKAGEWTQGRKALVTFMIVATLGTGIMLGTIVSRGSGTTRAVFEGTSAKPLVVPDPIVMSNTFSGIINKVEPAVVNISTVQHVEPRPTQRFRTMPPGGGPGSPQKPKGDGNEKDPLQDYFDHFLDNPDQGPQDSQSLGSGIIVDPKGYILTNNHVVEGATKIKVQLNGSSAKYDAKVIGTDVETDLAVIKIEVAHDLPFAKLGNSEGVQVGDWVLAIGSPFGLRATVTAGIVSARDRVNVGAENRQFQRFLQTDAAINPGNSGGPLVDMAGQVIGVNTAIMTGSRSLGNEGVGFALPSNMAISVYNQIISHGHVTRGSIGVTFNEDESSNPIVLRYKGAEYGMVLQSVEAGGPADKAGLQAEDVVTKVNGKPIHTGNDLVDPISQTPVGERVTLTFVHNKQAHDVSIVVGDRAKLFPDQAQNNNGDNSNPGAQTQSFGIMVGDITPDVVQKLGHQGVMVTREPEAASFGEDIGLHRGDLIVEINDIPITNTADYRKVISALKPGQDVVVKTVRADSPNGGVRTRLLAGVVPATDR
jgi:serine protease Do